MHCFINLFSVQDKIYARTQATRFFTCIFQLTVSTADTNLVPKVVLQQAFSTQPSPMLQLIQEMGGKRSKTLWKQFLITDCIGEHY